MPRRSHHAIVLAALLLLVTRVRTADAASCTVPADAGCATIQAALNQAGPGDTILVSAGTYSEKVSFANGGTAGGGYVTLQGAAAHGSILDGTGVAGSNMILIDTKSYVKVVGFEIRHNLNVSDGSGVRIIGSGAHIEIRDNAIHEVRGSNAMGITVYGTEAASISDLIIDGNQIYDCDPAPSEALTLNGNVELFEVTDNIVRDVNNIGIDFIGGETDIQPDASKVARNGVCRGNQVYRARSSYGGGFAGAIYVDGGRDILIERNLTSESDLGLEIGAENAGITARNITVRDNLIYRNDKVGIVFGGYSASVGRVENSFFLNNTLYQNDTLNQGLGELWIQFAEGNVIRNNIFFGDRDTLLYSENGNVNNELDFNLWFTSGADPTFVWNGTPYSGLPAFKAGSLQEASGLYADPQLVAAGAANFHLASTSPAVDAGDPAFVAGAGETDIDGATRVSGGRVDIGADEVSCGNGVIDVGESCDDGNLVDGDGCDSNCTLTAECGNAIRCGAEQCDDGNTVAGDCCLSGCLYEVIGSLCDDANLCTNDDVCDGAGTCAGSATAAATCKGVPASKSSIQVKDSSTDSRDLLKWKWSRGAATVAAEFGTPTSTTGYALCLYDGSANPQPRLNATVPASGLRWSQTTRGFRYKDKNAAASGVRAITLKEGEATKSSLSLQGKGADLSLPPLGLTVPVTVQLRNSGGGCWGATYSTFSSNDAAKFSAKSD